MSFLFCDTHHQYRHLSYLNDLLDRAEAGVMIDPTLLHYSFAFCASHVHGNRLVPTNNVKQDVHALRFIAKQTALHGRTVQ